MKFDKFFLKSQFSLEVTIFDRPLIGKHEI